MKKVLSLILVVCMAFSCLALSACVWEKMWGSTTSTVSTEGTSHSAIQPSERDPVLDELDLDYSDDFDEYDIEFVKTMRYTQFPGLPGYNHTTSFIEAMNQLDRNKNTSYKMTIDTQSILYFVAVYGEGGYYFLDLGGVVENVKWCKFSSYGDVPSEMEGKGLIGVYAVHSCVVEKDILNDVSYNNYGKYYVPLTDGYSEKDYKSQYSLSDTATWMDLRKLFGRATPLTVLHTAKSKYFYPYDLAYACGYVPGCDIYGYYTNEDGGEYLFPNSDWTIQELVDEYWAK